MHEAVGLFRKTAAVRERQLGRDNPFTLNAHRNLAGALLAARRPDEALTLIREVVEDYNRVLGPEHPYSRTAQYDLEQNGVSVGDLDRWRRSIPETCSVWPGR